MMDFQYQICIITVAVKKAIVAIDATAAENNRICINIQCMQSDCHYAATYHSLPEESHHLYTTNAWIVKKKNNNFDYACMHYR